MVEAKENRLFISLFRYYTWLLFRRRFNGVWLKNDYSAQPGGPVIYYSNHNSWWDGLIPFLLNEFLWHHNGRALIEEHQIHKYPFFKRIGAFSVNRNHRRDVISALRFAAGSLKRPNACLYLFPEGKIQPFEASLQPTFEGGLTWLSFHRSDLDIVPIALYIHTMHSDKPRLLIHIGEALRFNAKQTQYKKERTACFQNALGGYLRHINSPEQPGKMGFHKWI